MIEDMYGDYVKIQYLDADSWKSADDVIVMRRIGDDWIKVASFNSMSNDWAFTEAKAIARKTEQQMARLTA